MNTERNAEFTWNNLHKQILTKKVKEHSAYCILFSAI